MHAQQQQFLRYKNLVAQACMAYNSNEPITWDLSASKRSPAYIRAKLRQSMQEYVLNADWHDESIPASTVRNILNEWSFRSYAPSFVEIGPRKPRCDISPKDATDNSFESPRPSLRLNIDGSNRSFVFAIALLKNHDQITYPVLLHNFNVSFSDELYAQFPNIEIIPDTIAGVQSTDYILI